MKRKQLSKFLDCWIKSRMSLPRTLLFLLFAWGMFILCGSQSFALAADPSQDWLVQDPSPIATGSTQQSIPAVEGDIVIYKAGNDLFGINLAGDSGSQLLANNLSTHLSNLDIKSKRAIYQTSDGVRKFCSKDLSAEPWSSQPPLNCVAATTGYGISATNDGLGVYYNGSYGLSGSGGIFFVDFNTGTYSNIASSMYTSHPYVASTGPIWTEWQGWQGRYYSNVIMQGSTYLSGPGCEMNTSRDFARDAGGHIMYDRKVGTGDWDLVAYLGDPYSQNSTSRCAETVIAGGTGDQRDAEVASYRDENGQSHDLIVWEDSRNGNFDIYMKDLATSQEVAICQDAGDQINPAITLSADGRPFIVWQDKRSGDWDIYGTRVATAQDLAENYSPHLYLHSEEHFEPRKIDIMVDGEGTQLRARNGTTWDDLVIKWPTLTLDALGQFNTEYDQPSTHLYTGKYIDLPGNLTLAQTWPTERYLRSDYIDRYNSLINSNEYPETTYAHIVKNLANGETTIQYWLPYYFDNWNNYHEGDWEHVDVILNGNLDPIYAGYSQHDSGQRRPWDFVAGPDSHPIVYVARGSHANYFFPGPHKAPFRLTDETEAHELHQPSVSMLPNVSSSTLATLEGSPFYWLAYQGAWGELTSVPGGDGPQGPAATPEHNSTWDDPFSWFNGLCWDGSDSCEEEPRSIRGSVHSPVDIHLYDSQGRHVGKNDQGGIDEQIPGAEYIEIPDLHEKSITVHEGDGTEGYRFVLEGTGTGTFDFTLSSPDRAHNSADTAKYLTVPVTPSTEASVLLDQNKNYSLEIDTNGDGTVEEQRQPDSVVTQAVDLTPPGQTTDLSVTNTSSGTAALAFTAPGDDGNAGTAQYYDIRYSTSPITEDNWKEAMPFAEIPAPQVAGTSVSATATGLNAGTTYYFAFEARDETLQSSELSNVTAGTTTIPNLAWSMQRVYWASWNDYQNRKLSIDYRMSNTGTGSALSTTIQASLCIPTTVYIVTQLPSVVGDINPGSNITVTLKYYVPTNVGSFTTSTYSTCSDDADRTYWFPGPLF